MLSVPKSPSRQEGHGTEGEAATQGGVPSGQGVPWPRAT